MVDHCEAECYLGCVIMLNDVMLNVVAPNFSLSLILRGLQLGIVS
jgi:hypothetical protein